MNIFWLLMRCWVLVICHVICQLLNPYDKMENVFQLEIGVSKISSSFFAAIILIIIANNSERSWCDVLIGKHRSLLIDIVIRGQWTSVFYSVSTQVSSSAFDRRCIPSNYFNDISIKYCKHFAYFAYFIPSMILSTRVFQK